MTDKRIVIPHELIDLNKYINVERSNKFAAASLKNKQTSLCARYIKHHMDDGLKVKGKVDILFHWYAKDKRKDKDNISFAKKFILDGMQEAELVKNDGWSEIGDFQDKFHIDKDNPRVEAELIELGE